MSDEMKKQIESLIEKAATTQNAAEALHFSQAALNAANALCSMKVALGKPE